MAAPASAQPAPAAGGPAPDWEDPTTINYSEWEANLHPFDCTWPVPGMEYFDAECLSDQTQSEAARIETKAADRWVRAGLLFIGQLLAGVEFVKNTIQDGKAIASNLISITKGFDAAQPEQVAIRLAHQSDRLDETLTRVTSVMTQDSGAFRTNRYEEVEAIVLRALNIGKDVDLAAVSLSDQTTAMQMRLSGGNLKVIEAGEIKEDVQAPPPLPEDAETGPSLAAARTLSVDGVQFVSLGGPSLVGRPARGAAPDAPADNGACAVPEDRSEVDPMVVYQRSIALAKGAQTASLAPAADAQQAEEQLRAIQAREEQLERDSRRSAIFSSLRI
jgi:hypothetical protein